MILRKYKFLQKKVWNEKNIQEWKSSKHASIKN